MTEALCAYLDDIQEEDDFEDALIECYLAGEIEFDVLTESLGRQDADVVRSSKDILNRGDDLADEISDH